MFLNLLSPKQQEVFLQAALLVVAEDEKVDALEAELFSALMRECELEDAPSPAVAGEILEAAPTVLDGQVARRVFLLELAGVVVIDGEAHPDEVHRLREFAEVLGEGPGQVDRFLAYALETRRLVDEGRALIATGEA